MRRVVLVIVLLVSLLGVGAGSARATVSCDGTLQCAGKDGKGNCVSDSGSSVPVRPEQCKSGVAACSNTCDDGCLAISGNCEAIGGACGPGPGTCPGSEVCVYQSMLGTYGCTRFQPQYTI